jgi:hypothetical protein
MDAFEQLVSKMLWIDGLWVQTSVKVELTKEEKKKVGKPSMPRPELDIVAYSGRDNILRVVECKSYLDSPGVASKGLDGSGHKDANRYKLFSDDNLRQVVFNRLREQFTKSGLCAPNPEVRLYLACAHIRSDVDRQELRKISSIRDWELLDEDWLREHLDRMSKQGYENEVSYVVAKLLHDKRR